MHLKPTKPQEGIISATVTSTESRRGSSVMSEQENRRPFQCQVQLTLPEFLNSCVQKKTKWYFETSAHIEKFLPESSGLRLKKKKKSLIAGQGAYSPFFISVCNSCHLCFLCFG